MTKLIPPPPPQLSLTLSSPMLSGMVPSANREVLSALAQLIASAYDARRNERGVGDDARR